MKRRKEDILRLRNEGKSYKEIQKILSCSIASVTYHCGKGQKEKFAIRRKRSRQKSHPYTRKLEAFCSKARKFAKKLHSQLTYKNIIYRKLHTYNNNKINYMITVDDVINKISENPKCYLTGRQIDITKSRSFEFDHILPKSKGGPNTLENLGITCREANQAKRDLTLPEFIQLCKDVVQNFGYDILVKENLIYDDYCI